MLANLIGLRIREKGNVKASWMFLTTRERENLSDLTFLNEIVILIVFASLDGQTNPPFPVHVHVLCPAVAVGAP